jgi:alpha-glucosidase (family GH31 glycosyl hydrolase)
VGNEIFVPLITEFTRTLNFRLPPGTWVDYWDEQRTVSGEITGEPVPLGREPVFLRLGAIIPLEVQRDYTGHGTRESASSLTVLVFPNGTTSFRYYEAATAVWSTFTSVRSGTSITLDAVPGPTVPVLYRIGRVTSRPTAVGIEGGTVRVNQSGDLPEVGSEAAVNGSTTSAWFYDAPARRLIVKLVR